MESTQTVPPTAPEDALPATVDEIAAWMATASVAAIEAQAGWWLRSLATAQTEMAALDARHDAELELINAHYARLRAPLADHTAALERCLTAMAERITLPRNRKSIELAYGTIGRRTVPARVGVVDKAAALEWAKRVGAVRVKEEVDVKAATPTVLAMVAESGEVPDGWEYVAEHESAVVKPNSRAGVE